MEVITVYVTTRHTMQIAALITDIQVTAIAIIVHILQAIVLIISQPVITSRTVQATVITVAIAMDIVTTVHII